MKQTQNQHAQRATKTQWERGNHAWHVFSLVGNQTNMQERIFRDDNTPAVELYGQPGY